MKVPLLVVLTFIFALQSDSECKLVISVFPYTHNISLDIENIFNADKSTVNDIYWPQQEKQSTLNANVFFDNLNQILTQFEDEPEQNNVNNFVAPEKQSTVNSNRFVDNFKKILTHVEDGSKANNKDDVNAPEKQITLNPNVFVDNFNKIITHVGDRSKENNNDNVTVPEKQTTLNTNVFVDNYKKILPHVENRSIKNYNDDVPTLEEQSTLNPNVYVDNYKKILPHVEGGPKINNNDNITAPEEQNAMNPNAFVDNFNKILTHVGDKSKENNNDDFTAPEKQTTLNPKVFVNNYKKILPHVEDRSIINNNDDVTALEKQTTLNPKVFVDNYKKMLPHVEDGPKINNNDNITVPEEQSTMNPNVYVDNYKKILPYIEDRSKKNNNDDVTAPEEQSTLNPNVFADNYKKNFPHVEDGLKEYNQDDIIAPEEQSTVNPKVFLDSFKNTLIQGEDGSKENNKDDVIAPKEHIEYKLSDEDLVTYMSSLSVPQLIKFHGYPVESHTITTDDGYILTIHRIPYSKTSKNKVSPKKTVLLHHGLFGSSAHWLIPGPTKALGYILSDAGYDVWMANVRGNTYSRAHVSKHVRSREFWDFTFHEVSQNDLPAVIDYIMEVKGLGVKINYIGHSMGTTVLFALLSTKTQYNKVLRAGFALAPVAYMTQIKGPMKRLATYNKSIHRVIKALGGGNQFLPQSPFSEWLSKGLIKRMNDEDGTFEESMSVLFGHDIGQFNKTLLPLILAHANEGASTKTVLHYAQEIKHRGKFQMFDYGFWKNLKYYGWSSPPEYPLHKITLPIALFSGENDWLSSVCDAKKLYRQLVNPIEHYIVPLKEFNHGDFLWAIDAPNLLYARLLYLLEEGVRDSPGHV